MLSVWPLSIDHIVCVGIKIRPSTTSAVETKARQFGPFDKASAIAVLIFQRVALLCVVKGTRLTEDVADRTWRIQNIMESDDARVCLASSFLLVECDIELYSADTSDLEARIAVNLAAVGLEGGEGCKPVTIVCNVYV